MPCCESSARHIRDRGGAGPSRAFPSRLLDGVGRVVADDGGADPDHGERVGRSAGLPHQAGDCRAASGGGCRDGTIPLRAARLPVAVALSAVVPTTRALASAGCRPAHRTRDLAGSTEVRQTSVRGRSVCGHDGLRGRCRERDPTHPTNGRLYRRCQRRRTRGWATRLCAAARRIPAGGHPERTRNRQFHLHRQRWRTGASTTTRMRHRLIGGRTAPCRQWSRETRPESRMNLATPVWSSRFVLLCSFQLAGWRLTLPQAMW